MNFIIRGKVGSGSETLEEDEDMENSHDLFLIPREQLLRRCLSAISFSYYSPTYRLLVNQRNRIFNKKESISPSWKLVSRHETRGNYRPEMGGRRFQKQSMTPDVYSHLVKTENPEAARRLERSIFDATGRNLVTK